MAEIGGPVDWNMVRVAHRTDLVIEPMSDNQMARLFSIPADEIDDAHENSDVGLPDDGQSPCAS